jgi:hypothetical protein
VIIKKKISESHLVHGLRWYSRNSMSHLETKCSIMRSDIRQTFLNRERRVLTRALAIRRVIMHILHIAEHVPFVEQPSIVDYIHLARIEKVFSRGRHFPGMRLPSQPTSDKKKKADEGRRR